MDRLLNSIVSTGATGINNIDINKQCGGQTRGHTPMVKSIATIPSVQDRSNVQIGGGAIDNHITKAKDIGDANNKRTIKSSVIICYNMGSPSEGGTPSTARESGQICQPGGCGAPGGGSNDDPDDNEDYNIADKNSKDSYYKEFTLVNPNMIIISVFSGVHLQTKPYMQFNKVVKKFIKAQGPRSMMLLSILDKVDSRGGRSGRLPRHIKHRRWAHTIHSVRVHKE